MCSHSSEGQGISQPMLSLRQVFFCLFLVLVVTVSLGHSLAHSLLHFKSLPLLCMAYSLSVPIHHLPFYYEDTSHSIRSPLCTRMTVSSLITSPSKVTFSGTGVHGFNISFGVTQINPKQAINTEMQINSGFNA